MVHGAVLRSPYAHAKDCLDDMSEALAHPNVAAVTAKDLETPEPRGCRRDPYDNLAVLGPGRQGPLPARGAFVIATDEYWRATRCR
jgi:carbon-monoxide dehydrogenase large subunit